MNPNDRNPQRRGSRSDQGTERDPNEKQGQGRSQPGGGPGRSQGEQAGQGGSRRNEQGPGRSEADRSDESED